MLASFVVECREKKMSTEKMSTEKMSTEIEGARGRLGEFVSGFQSFRVRRSEEATGR
jgi:hypothetical protein